MFIRGVVDDQVHNQLHAQSVNIGNELVEVFHGSENRINILVITDVVTVISLWRSIDRRKPQDINTQLFQVSQSRADSLKVPKTITIGVLE